MRYQQTDKGLILLGRRILDTGSLLPVAALSGPTPLPEARVPARTPRKCFSESPAPCHLKSQLSRCHFPDFKFFHVFPSAGKITSCFLVAREKAETIVAILKSQQQDVPVFDLF